MIWILITIVGVVAMAATTLSIGCLASQRRVERLLAELAHAQAMDVAIYYRRESPETACSYVRQAVSPRARNVMLRREGARYDDWLREMHDHALRAQPKTRVR